MQRIHGKVKCHCCGKLSTDASGKPKRARICWDCINFGGSVERNCSLHARTLNIIGEVKCCYTPEEVEKHMDVTWTMPTGAASFLLGKKAGQGFIMCLRCGLVSYHPDDIKEKYCGKCHASHAIGEPA